jgi:hypothetical protein
MDMVGVWVVVVVVVVGSGGGGGWYLVVAGGLKVVEEVVAKVVVVMVASGGCFSCPSHLIPSTVVGTQRPGCLDLIPTAPHNTRWRSWQHLGPEITLDGVCRVAKRESCRYPVRPTARHPARVVHGSISWPPPWVVHVQIILGHGFCAAVVRSVFRIVVCRQNTCKKIKNKVEWKELD